jgi:hypothetical protein
VFASGSISDHIQMIISNVRIDYEQLALGELSEELAKEIAQMTTTEIMYGAGTSDESGMPRPSNPVGEFPRRETDPLLRAMNSSKPREATHKCAYTQCEIVKEGLLRCGGCTSVHYCSAEHQKLHWVGDGQNRGQIAEDPSRLGLLQLPAPRPIFFFHRDF